MGMKFLLLGGAVLLAALYWGVRDGFEPGSIRNKRVLVTGASSGIGEQLAYHYSRLGARILITARRAELLDKVAQKCQELGAAKIELVAADMSKPADRARVVQKAQESLGGLDQLILNHAYFGFVPWTGSAEDMATLEYHMEVDFYSYVDLASRATSMLEASSGNIGVVSSVAGKLAGANTAPYVAAKHALQGFFASWRQELNFKKTGVSVTLCVLGLIDTEKAIELVTKNYDNADVSMAASAEDTAMAIIESVTTRKYEMTYPFLATVLVNVHKFIPGYLEDYVARMSFKN